MRAFSAPVEAGAEEKPHCTCGGGKGFSLDVELSDVEQLWVCAASLGGCGKPTRQYLEGWLHRIGFYG